MAKTIGTAPLSPTHETKTLSLTGIFLKGARHRNTVSGLVTKIIIKLIIRPGINSGISSLGLTSSPSVRNMIS